jgi:hypothetical protein
VFNRTTDEGDGMSRIVVAAAVLALMTGALPSPGSRIG